MQRDMRKWMRLIETIRPSSTQITALIRGVKAGKLLVHVRIQDGSNHEWGLEPSSGKFLQSTEAWQTSVESHGEGPELIFFADDFTWVKSNIIRQIHANDEHAPMEALFVRKSDTIYQYVGDGKVRSSTGKIIPYNQSSIADYENPVYADLPAGVEYNDWFTTKLQDVLAVVDVADLLHYLT